MESNPKNLLSHTAKEKVFDQDTTKLIDGRLIPRGGLHTVEAMGNIRGLKLVYTTQIVEVMAYHHSIYRGI